MILRLSQSRSDRTTSVLTKAAISVIAAASTFSGDSPAQILEPVSPGHIDSTATVTGACPTFHWGASDVSGSAVVLRQFLVAFELVPDASGDDNRLSEQPALQIDLPASARGFTLDAERCLAAGRYAWAIGAEVATGDAGAGTITQVIWSDPLRFDVPEPRAQRDESPEVAAQAAQSAPNGGVARATDTDRSTTSAGRQTERVTPESRSRVVGVSGNGSVADAPAAVRGESLDTGDSHGVAGMTHAPGGAGVLAANEGGGADLLLDGGADTETDTLVSQSTLDRSSSGAEVFSFVNSGSGSMTLQVDGETVATGPFVSSVATGTGLTGGGNGDVTVEADLSALQARVSSSCPIGSSIRVIDAAGAVTCETDDSGELSAGNQLALDGGVLDVVEGPGSDLDADTLDGLEATELALASHGHFAEHWSGSTNSGGLLITNSSGAGGASAIRATLSSSFGGPFAAAVYGVNASTTGNGIGVLGAQGGSGWGVFGQTPDGRGVVGQSTTGTGVYGIANAKSGLNFGVYATSSSPTGYGLFAAGAGRAIKAESSAAGAVVEVESTYAGVQASYGIQAEAEEVGISGAGRHGVMGTAVEDPTDALHIASGVYASGTDGSGSHLAFSRTPAGVPSSSYGVYSFAGSADIARAGYFVGSVDVTGTLTKGGGSFLIDHPLDPENKTLSHSFVESPDMMNIYNGNVVLDDNGEAWVTLPEWFDALNRDARYQLTGIGSAAMVYVAEEVQDNRFKIAGGTPAMKVSWQVTGIRQDAWANENRIQVETDKHPGLRGRFVHPEAHGMPAELGMHSADEERASLRRVRTTASEDSR